jgi:hypothetical protein
MRYVCLIGWGAALGLAIAFPRQSFLGWLGALLLLGFSLALLVLFVGFLARVVGARRKRVRWVLIAVVVVLPAALFGFQRLHTPGDKAQIERTIRVVAASSDPSYCDTDVTASYLRQMTGAKTPFADDFCRSEAGKSPADSVDVSRVAVADDRATALVAYEGGSIDGSQLLVELTKDDGAWKLNRRVAFERFDRARFDRAYRGLLLAFGSPPRAVACALGKTTALSNPVLERAILDQAHRDREGVERSLVKTIADPKFAFPQAAVECAAAKVKASSDAELVHLQRDLIAYNELLLNCEPESLFDFQQRELAAYEDLDAETVDCVLEVFRRLPPTRSIRLSYNQVRYESLIDSCRQ